MIIATTRVSEALLERPDLRNVLPAFHPAFARLNHPVLGRVLPKLVTVADAARIAGVDVDALVAVMNCPIGTPLPSLLPSAPRPPEAPAPAWFDAARVTELDTRPILDRGDDPLAAILSALRGLPPHGQLTLIVPFEPVPLIGLLHRQGWDSWQRWEGAHCRVTFARVHGATVTPAPTAPAVSPVRSGDGWALDVRALPPPEPMRAALAAIDAGHLPLRIVHEREPALLFPKLRERGLVWTVTHRVPQAEDGVAADPSADSSEVIIDVHRA